MFDARKSKIDNVRRWKIENRPCSTDNSGVISGVIWSDETIDSGVFWSDEIINSGVTRSDLK